MRYYEIKFYTILWADPFRTIVLVLNTMRDKGVEKHSNRSWSIYVKKRKRIKNILHKKTINTISLCSLFSTNFGDILLRSIVNLYPPI